MDAGAEIRRGACQADGHIARRRDVSLIGNKHPAGEAGEIHRWQQPADIVHSEPVHLHSGTARYLSLTVERFHAPLGERDSHAAGPVQVDPVTGLLLEAAIETGRMMDDARRCRRRAHRVQEAGALTRRFRSHWTSIENDDIPPYCGQVKGGAGALGASADDKELGPISSQGAGLGSGQPSRSS